MAVINSTENSNIIRQAKMLSQRTGIPDWAFAEVMISKPNPPHTWIPPHQKSRSAHRDCLHSLKECIDQFKKSELDCSEAENQLIELAQQYLEIATTGEEFFWLSRQIPVNKKDFLDILKREWDACMIYHISRLETVDELVEAYKVSPRSGSAKRYTLHRMVEIARKTS